jgi:hypothetical protein
MPLIHSTSKKAIGENIAIEKHAHPDMPIKQAEAIAFSEQRQAESHGKKKAESHIHRATRK